MIEFRWFSTLHRAYKSTRNATGQTSIFADRRDTLEGSQALRQNRKSTKFNENTIQQCFSHESRVKISIFSPPGTTWRRFLSHRRVPEPSWAFVWTSRGALPDAPGAPQARRGCPKTLPRRSRHARETPSGRFWAPRGVPRESRDQFSLDFGCSGTSPGTDFGLISCQFALRFSGGFFAS